MIDYTDQKLAEFWNKNSKPRTKKLEEELSKQLKKLFPKKKIPKTSSSKHTLGIMVFIFGKRV